MKMRLGWSFISTLVVGAASPGIVTSMTSDNEDRTTSRSCGYPIPQAPIVVARESSRTTDTIDDDHQSENELFVHTILPGSAGYSCSECQVASLLREVEAGVMVHFLNPRNETNQNENTENDYDSFSGWKDEAMWMNNMIELAQDKVVAYVDADIAELTKLTLHNDSTSGLFLTPPVEFANTSCVVLDFHKESLDSVCITAFWSCDGQTASKTRSMTSQYQKEKSPVTDLGVMKVQDLHGAMELSHKSDNPEYFFVRYGQEWDTITRVTNEDWESIAQAALWWKKSMNVELIRVDCSVEVDVDPCNSLNTTVPQFLLYNTTQVIDIDQEQAVTFPAERYYSGNEFNRFMMMDMYEFLQNNTSWTPEYCSELASEGLPFWTPCESKLEDIKEPFMTEERLYHVTNRGEIMYLLQNFDRLDLHFTDHLNEASVDHVLPLFRKLATEYMNLTDRGIAALAYTEVLTEDTLANLMALFDNGTFDGFPDPWFAIDQCSINYGMLFWSSCMDGSYGRISSDTLQFDCDGEFGAKLGEWGCSGVTADDMPGREKSMRRQIHMARLAHEPTSDDGIVTPETMSEILAANETVFVRYGHFWHSRHDRTNEAWELLAQKVKGQKAESESVGNIKLFRVHCDGRDSVVCQDIHTYPTFLLHHQGKKKMFQRNRLPREDDNTYSESFANAMLEFLRTELDSASPTSG